jgi:flagellar basal-body rod protein FlgC
MGMFGAIEAASSGATVSRFWIDAIADNVANLNTIRPAGEDPFRSRLVIARTVTDADGQGRGVQVAGIALKGGDPVQVWDPSHPYADANGMVTRPNVDMTEEMTNLLLAQRTYQINLAVIDRARDAYMAALQIGRR